MEDWDIEQQNPIEFLVGKEVRQERVNICKSCEHLTPFKICSQCGCIMPVKTWLTHAHCPTNKWQSVTIS